MFVSDTHSLVWYGVNPSKIVDIIEDCKNLEGDIHDKAVFLLKSLVQKHIHL